MHAALHGPDAACHDFIAGAPGAFAAVVAQVAAARAAGELIAVTTHVTRSGYRVLGDMPALLAWLGAAA
ncbi:MAG: hypothetical protein H6709_08090 [Kofleriaceae bacterium]|nr:hypothetical protein [Kofleriaceae bacterium]